MELFEPARCGDLDAVKRLIQQRVDVNTTNRNNQSALYCACDNGHATVAQYLLDNGASVNLGATPLIAAVSNSHYDCVKLLLQHSAPVNCTSTNGESSISVALQKRHYSIILLLLQYGAIPPTSLGNFAVQLLKHAKVEDTKTIQKLINQQIINLTSESIFLAAFSFAFKRGSVELAERMMSIDSYSKIEQLYPDAAYCSAKNDWPTILSKLTEKGVDINVRTDGQTPLYVSCEEGHDSVVSLLLNNGADPNIPNKPPATKYFLLPLQIAVRRGYATIVDMLLKRGAKLNQSGEPLLHVACGEATECKIASEVGETKSVEHMLSTIRLLLLHGLDVNAISDAGGTALYLACKSQQLQVVQILLEAGADVNLTSDRRYPLMAACDGGNIELINLLLQAGADVKCSKSNNETCLHAVINAHSSITDSQKAADSVSKLDIVNTIRSLLDGGVDVDARCSQGETALYRASKAGHEDIVQLLLEAGAETSGSTSRCPLYAACEHGSTQIADLLLQHGADPNASSASTEGPYIPLMSRISAYVASSSSSPICCAMKKGYIDVVDLLLKHGADVNTQDHAGKSALIYFIELLNFQTYKASQILNPPGKRNLDMLKSMLLAGGDVNIKSVNNGQNALHIASSFGICDVMMVLIQHGANCNHLTASGKSALDLACEKGHEEAIELLLKNGAKPDTETATTGSSFNADSGYYSRHPAMPVLCTAAKNGSETMVKMLLKHEANVNASDEKGNTALHLATSNAVIETLLKAGANANATNDNGETVLSALFKKRQADTNVVEMLLNFGANPNTCFPLHDACESNDANTVRLLLAHGVDANLVKESQRLHMLGGSWMFGNVVQIEYTEPSPLCIACKHGNVDMVDCLLQNGASATFADDDGNSALHFALERLGQQASSEEYDPIVTLLLQHKAAVNVVSNKGESPLYVACTKGLSGVVKQLLDCRADVGLTTTNSNKYPLMIACERKFRDIATVLLKRGADANVSKDKQTPLKLASANGDAMLVKKLLSYGADVNQMQNTSDTALHVAVDRSRNVGNEAFVKVVQTLLKSGAEINARNDKGETPLYLVCKPTDDKVNVNIVQILLEHGSDPNTCPTYVCSSSWSRDNVLPPLSAAASFGNNELVMLLIQFGARLNHNDNLGRTALHFAIDNDVFLYTGRLQSTTKSDPSTAEILLSAGADANVVDNTGVSPLYLACEKGKTEFVKLLLSRGANPNMETVDKYPIHAASRGHHCDTVKLLLEYNADVTVRDKNGKTALRHAVESEPRSSGCENTSNKHLSVVQLLLAQGADPNI